MQQLTDFVRLYALRRDICAEYVDELENATRQLTAWVGTDDVAVDDDLVNGWLVYLRDSGYRPSTIKGKRTSIVTLLRAAAEDGLRQSPQRIRRIKVPHSVIDGWDREQIGKLVIACDTLAGWFARTGVNRRLFMRSLIMAYWDTALRLGDLLSIERTWIWPQGASGYLSVVQHKSGRSIHKALRAETMTAINESFPPERRLIWPQWSGHRDAIYALFREVVETAGLTGTSKWIRRGSASEVEAMQPGMGTRHCGHSPQSFGLFDRSYRVHRIADSEPTLPPRPQLPPEVA